VTDRDVHIDDGVSADFSVNRDNGKRPDVTAGTDLDIARQNSSWMYELRWFPSEFPNDSSDSCARLVFANGAEKPQFTALEYVVYLLNASVHRIALMLSFTFCGVGVRPAEHAPKSQTPLAIAFALMSFTADRTMAPKPPAPIMTSIRSHMALPAVSSLMTLVSSLNNGAHFRHGGTSVSEGERHPLAQTAGRPSSTLIPQFRPDIEERSLHAARKETHKPFVFRPESGTAIHPQLHPECDS
jgi:hypothetical protein